MTIQEAINQAVAVTGQVVGDEILVRWLNELDGRLLLDFFHGDAWRKYDPEDDLGALLLVPQPWDGLYVFWLEAMTYYTNGEYDRYANARAMYEEALDGYKKWIQRQVKSGVPCPKMAGSPSGSGTETVEPGEHPEEWYWLSAYAIAVKHGYVGTESEWLDMISAGGGGGAIDVDPTPTQGSTNAVSSGGVYTALSGKQSTLTFDSAPTESSTNPVTSGGVYTALAGKQDALTFDDEPTEDSANPVTSGGIYSATEDLWGEIDVIWADIDGKADSILGIYHGYCDTAAATQIKAVSAQGITELKPDLQLRVYFLYAQSYNGAPKLNLNNWGAKDIYLFGTTPAAQYEWRANEIIDLVYDGSAWQIIGRGRASTTYYGATRLSSSHTSTSTDMAATPSAVKEAYDRADQAYTLANGKQDALTWDYRPTAGSTHALTSDAVYTALLTKQDKLSRWKTYLDSSDWSGPSSQWYTQTISVYDSGGDDLSPTAYTEVSLRPTPAQIAALMTAGVKALMVENNNGTLTAYAMGAAPSAAMEIDVIVAEVGP